VKVLGEVKGRRVKLAVVKDEEVDSIYAVLEAPSGERTLEKVREITMDPWEKRGEEFVLTLSSWTSQCEKLASWEVSYFLEKYSRLIGKIDSVVSGASRRRRGKSLRRARRKKRGK